MQLPLRSPHPSETPAAEHAASTERAQRWRKGVVFAVGALLLYGMDVLILGHASLEALLTRVAWCGQLLAYSWVVRKLDEEVVRRLKERAKANGRSAEAEHRVILEETLRPKRSGKELWESLSRGGPVDVSFDTVTDQSTRPASFD